MCVLKVTTGYVPAVDSAHALTADISVAETASAAELFLADGVVLTGTATGLPADPGELRGERTQQGHAAGPKSTFGCTSLYLLFLKEKKKEENCSFIAELDWIMQS